jgi:hypothetical protein
VQPLIDLAPGTETSRLASSFADRLRQAAVADEDGRRTFFALKATVFLVEFDTDLSATLRFDHGRLTIHEGTIGMPSVTFGGPRRALESLDRIRFSELPTAMLGKRRRPGFLDESRGSTPPPSDSGPSSWRPLPKMQLRELLELFASGDLKIYGLVSHPRTVARFLRLLKKAD